MTEEAIFCVESCRDWYQAFANRGKGEERSVKELLTTAKLIESLSAQLEQVTRERDAAVKDLKDELKKHSIISMCEHCMYKPADDYIPNDCMDCVNSCNWQWRGVEVDG